MQTVFSIYTRNAREKQLKKYCKLCIKSHQLSWLTMRQTGYDEKKTCKQTELPSCLYNSFCENNSVCKISKSLKLYEFHDESICMPCYSNPITQNLLKLKRAIFPKEKLTHKTPHCFSFVAYASDRSDISYPF